jgi:hypothetical protein
MQTRVRFADGDTFALSEQAATAFGGYSTTGGWSLRVSVGVLIDGALEDDAGAGTHDLSAGFVGGLAAARQWKHGGRLLVTGSSRHGAGGASTHAAGAADDPRLVAGDVRVGLIAGRTFGEIWNPYVLARGFGGPIWWSIDGMDVTGTDTRHFQLGAGLSVVMSIGLTIVVDVSALGERGASLGASWRL